MPKKQAVYGKRPKSTCITANIFASPDNSKRKAVETIKILKDDDIKSRKQQQMEAQNLESPVRNRKVLGEISGNAVPNVDVPKERKDKKSSTKKRPRKDEVAELTEQLDKTNLVEGVVHGGIEGQKEEPDPLDTGKVTPKVVVPAEEQEEAKEDIAVGEAPIESSKIPQTESATTAPSHTDCYTEHCASLLELTAYPISSFSDWAEELRDNFSLVKIAEASFGEVYRLSLQPEAAEDTDLPLSKNDESVLKVIALKQPLETLPKNKRDRERALEKAENMSKPDDVASELKLLQRLSDIPGFTNFRDLRVLQGRPPGPFAEAFTAFNKAQKAAKKELSIFPDPAKKASYSKDQLWAVIEMQDAGTDLEKLVAQGISSNIWVVWDIFWQVVLALAKGEEEAEFEHRDLHLGNICVRTPEPVDESAIDVSKLLGFTSFEATLIDYTVSRASMIPASLASDEPPTSQDDSVAYIDLANDPHLFYGDSAEEYQYDIYRYMRGSIYYSTPYARFPNDGTTSAISSQEELEDQSEDAKEEEEQDQGESESEEAETQLLPTPPSHEQMAAIAASTSRDWRQFHPLTNLVWLHYILYMLLEQMSWPSSAKKAPKSKKTNPEAYARHKRALELEQALLQVQEELDPGWLGQEGSLGRSGELVQWAVEEGWLGVEDVVRECGSGGDGGEFTVFEEEDGGDDELVKQLEGLALQKQQPVDSEEEAVQGAEKKGKKEKKKTASRSKRKA